MRSRKGSVTPERIETAIEVLGEMSSLASDAENSNDALAMVSALTLAHSYMVEYHAHIAQGREPAEALQKTIRGELKIGDPRDK
jgi:ATP phosphoribosyltransferase regulatory subunit HisZ